MPSSVPPEYCVDAHALIWFLEGSSRLGADAKAALSDPNSVLYLPATALAEACWIVERGRTTIPSVAVLLTDIDRDPRFSVIPLDRAIVELSTTLTVVGEMHDRQIVASALHLQASGHSVALLTRDENIRGSGLVSVVW